MGAVVPYFQKLQREGEEGVEKSQTYSIWYSGITAFKPLHSL